MTPREPGSVLEGKYEIVRRLGSGGMGEVHLVRHVHLQELRVVKILRQDLAADSSAQQRFLREARLATQIKHPNVAILYDYSRLDDGSFYTVWEHIEGQDLGDRLRREGPFPVQTAIQLAIQALRGLAAIHATGVIHRDISPDNLMITRDRAGRLRVKIIDLGLAKNLGPDPGAFEITEVGMFMGKLQYCSPEQAGAGADAALDHRSDLYSLGLVLYEMATGAPPFHSENQAGFIFKRLSEDPLPMVGRNPEVEVPEDLDRVVRRALARDRDQRYPDAGSFILALERVAHGMAAHETQEVPILAAAARPALAPRPRSSSELTREERVELLAQIERAAARTREVSAATAPAEAALAAGRFEEARAIVAEIEAANPRSLGLDRIKQRLAAEGERRARAQALADTERLLDGYLERRQMPLARLALETLLELAPDHPRRGELEGALAAAGADAEEQRKLAAAVAFARAALERGDFRTARREADAIARLDRAATTAEAFRVEVEEAERSRQRNLEVERLSTRLEGDLEAGRLEQAAQELEALAEFPVSRVTLDGYRERLAAARARAERQAQAQVYEARFRQALEARDWLAARAAAGELEAHFPAHPRAAAMLAEADRAEADAAKRQGIEQGERQVESLLERGDWRGAELALEVLAQLDPQNRHRRRFEKAVRALQKG
ncbi:MAG TPA: serine/threonine-protein kinase [Thermoanaerobaculia bacterium]|nr:serine/threonine-protein kinase [Thermoanaerobaculia bacterium]